MRPAEPHKTRPIPASLGKAAAPPAVLTTAGGATSRTPLAIEAMLAVLELAEALGIQAAAELVQAGAFEAAGRPTDAFRALGRGEAYARATELARELAHRGRP